MPGVVQAGCVAGLGIEPGAERRVVGVLVLEDLDRDLAVEHGVAGAPHLAHATGGDALDALVALAGVGSERRCRRCSLADHRLHHRLGDRSGQPAAGDLVTRDAGVLHEHGDRDGGSLGGGEGHEPGVRRPVGRALRGSGLAGDLDAGDLRPSSRCRCRRPRPSSRSGPVRQTELIAGWSGISSGSVFSKTSSLGDLSSSTR